MATNSGRARLFRLVEEGLLDPYNALEMCAKWMTDDDVRDMLDSNELSERFMEDEWDDLDEVGMGELR